MANGLDRIASFAENLGNLRGDELFFCWDCRALMETGNFVVLGKTFACHAIHELGVFY